MQVPSRCTARLSKPINHRLNAYAVAAGAAGVGLLASVPSAHARIVYTPANIPIVQDGAAVDLDLNHDGINDFQLLNITSTQRMRRAEGFHRSYLGVSPAQQSNRVFAIDSKGGLFAAALQKGKHVGPHSPFQPSDFLLSMWACAGGTSGFSCDGPWYKVNQAFLGLKFVIKGKTHFGWAHIRQAGETSPTIVGYAYETVPNKRILTGQKKEASKTGDDQTISRNAPPLQHGTLALLAAPPAPLGVLALGAQGRR